jgi:hypothetical protein
MTETTVQWRATNVFQKDDGTWYAEAWPNEVEDWRRSGHRDAGVSAIGGTRLEAMSAVLVMCLEQHL